MLIKDLLFLTIYSILINTILTINGDKRKKIILHGDLMIGALIPVHEQPSFNSDTSIKTTRKCGIIRDQYGIQRVEALLYMLDKINNNQKLLPGIKLGIEIRDECWETSIALEETIDFIKHTIASRDDQDEIYENPPIFSDETQMTEFTFNNTKDKICQKILKDKINENKILAVIGPAGSSIAINVQNLLQLFDIPQIGYSATSTDLSDKKLFKTFLRVVPSDYLQVKAMADVVVKMNWTYVFAIYTDGSYGQGGMEAFRNQTSYLNICLAMYEKIREYANDVDYEIIVKKMNATTSARVIVCFCYGETIRGLLGAINRLSLKGRFIILGSDGWSDRIDVAKDYYEEAVGSLSLKAHSPVVTDFHDYFAQLNPSNNLRNVWFKEYWEYRFNCFIEEESKQKFTNPCKRKCPINFEQIGNKCYWLSNESLTWSEAKEMCKSKFHDSKLLDLNNEKDLENLFTYLDDKDMNKHLSKMHVRIEIKQHINLNNNLNEYQFTEDNNLIEQNLKFMSCSTVKTKKRKKSHVNNDEDESDFESSLSGEDVITFYNNKITQNNQCMSIFISKTRNNETNSNYSYCAEFKNCQKKLPFVCKIEIDDLKKSSRMADFYPDSLRNYQQDPKMSYVINALLSIVHGLSKAHKKVCNGTNGLCENLKKLHGNDLLTFIRDSSFSGITGEKINFDLNGDPPGRYVLLNVQKENDPMDNLTKYVYKEIGNWNTDTKLTLDLSKIMFPGDEQKLISICSQECQFGHVKQIRQGGLKCCWNCKKCEDYSYILDEHTCQECDLGYWPNVNLTGCDKLPLKYLEWSEPASLFALLVSIIGILVNTFVTHIFVTFSNTCIVKSTTKELSYIILFGAYLCYFMTIPLVLKPSVISCYLTRFLPGFNLSIIYGSLLTKTNRIARILSRSKKRIITRKLKFMSLTAQILITSVIIAIECGLIIAGLIYEPDVIWINYSKRHEAILQCKMERISVIGPLGYNMFLIALCTIYAIQTRNLPENFNEAKFIGFSMYTTCVIWLAFFPLFFGSDYKIITLCLSTSFSATVILAFLFIPKVYIIIFKPEKNQRSAFTTSKNIRCHFGSNLQSGSFLDDMTSSQRKQSSGMFLLAGLTGLRTSSQRTESSRPKSSINYTRYAFRPKFSPVYNGYSDQQSLDSFNNCASIYQISDRSCQTSLELLPTTKNSVKRRKTLKMDKSVSLDQNGLIEGDETINNVGALGAMGTFLFLPLIATANQQQLKNSSMLNQEKENESKEKNEKIEKNEPVTPPSPPAPLPLLKEKKASFFRRSITSLKRANFRKKKHSFDLGLSFCSELERVEESKLSKIESLSNIEEYFDENNNELSKLDCSDTLSFKEPTTDEYSFKMNHEEDSLEDLRQAFSKNANLVVNWDYVQSSGYL